MSESSVAAEASGRSEVRVWDLFVRIFHWSLIVFFAAAYISEGEPLWFHTWAGYIVATLLVLRLIWGFVGPRYARFADFVYAPATVIADLRDHLKGRAKRYLGHNPAGGAMIVLLIVSLTGTVFTGMATLAQAKNAGPLAPWLGNATALSAPLDLSMVSAARADDDERSPGERRIRSPFKDVHEFFATLTLVLAGFHLAGVLFSSLAHRENLVRAMITGRKRAEPGAAG